MADASRSLPAFESPRITVVQGRQRHVVSLGNTSFQLMREIEEVTAIRPEDQVLLIQGKKITNDCDISLASLGLKAGKKIMLMVRRGDEKVTGYAISPGVPNQSDAICQQVGAAISNLDALELEIEGLKKIFPLQGSLQERSSTDKNAIQQKLIVMSEKCMKMLLDLDNIQANQETKQSNPPAWKLERKTAVDRLHRALDSLDDISTQLARFE